MTRPQRFSRGKPAGSIPTPAGTPTPADFLAAPSIDRHHAVTRTAVTVLMVYTLLLGVKQ